MYTYHQPTTFYQHPGASSVSSPVHFRRYEKSPPPVQPSLSVTLRPSTNRDSFSQDVTLTLRQQPKEALVTTEGKEKARKPVDPPPIIQLNVKSAADPQQNFLQSPYLFMCTSLYRADKEQSIEGNASKSLAGSLVSSLHRLKDIDNKDGAFFVFGDISVKVQGTFRLHFSLFDLHKETNEVQYLGGITSDPFKVLLPKDFKGMDESTYLSRAFSDQGVRLRLRKEPRAMIGSKRPYPYGTDTPTSNTPIRPNMHEYSSSYSDPTASPNKRFRSETEDVKREAYQDHPTSLSASTFSPNYSTSQYQARPPTMSTPYSIGQQYPGFGAALTTGSTTPYQFRAGMGSSMGLGDPLLPTSTENIAGTLATQQSFSQLYPNYAPQRNAPSMFPNFSQ